MIKTFFWKGVTGGWRCMVWAGEGRPGHGHALHTLRKNAGCPPGERTKVKVFGSFFWKCSPGTAFQDTVILVEAGKKGCKLNATKKRVVLTAWRQNSSRNCQNQPFLKLQQLTKGLQQPRDHLLEKVSWNSARTASSVVFAWILPHPPSPGSQWPQKPTAPHPGSEWRTGTSL